jgi:hypothetical protein
MRRVAAHLLSLATLAGCLSLPVVLVSTPSLAGQRPFTRFAAPTPLVIAASLLASMPVIHRSRLPVRLTFGELRHPWYNLVRDPRDDARIAALRAAQAAARARRAAAAAAVAPVAATAPQGRYAGSAGLERCIISAESGGNPQIWGGNHWGLYQFDAATWAAYGGDPGAFGNAGAGTQHGIYENVVAKGSQAIYDAWSADGCPQQYGLLVVSAVKIPLGRHHRHHHRRHHHVPLRIRALSWALRQRGKPYMWGGTGPYGFDCSGLVYAAYHHAGRAGRRLARDTFEMLGQVGGLLIQTWHPKRGDLAFYGSGHVELLLSARRHRTFGALDPGTRIGRHHWNGWWAPTMFFRLRV